METGICVSCTSDSSQNVVSLLSTEIFSFSLSITDERKIRYSLILLAEQCKYNENKLQMRINFPVLSVL